MRKLCAVLIVFILITGCGPSQAQPQITDNGNPGHIKTIVFFDENHNGTRDQDEVGISDRVSISQDNSCPASNVENLTQDQTNPSGEVIFNGLKPGHYCVAYMGNLG